MEGLRLSLTSTDLTLGQRGNVCFVNLRVKQMSISYSNVAKAR